MNEIFCGEKNEYELVRLLGSGGMCDVFEAESVSDKANSGDLNPAKRYALKRLKKQVDADAERKMRALFENEIKILEAFGEVEGVPKLIDKEGSITKAADKGDDFYVMELVEGKALKKESLSGKEAIRLGVELCDILGRLHGLPTPIVHLDIKPSNLMLSENGRLFLVDFGLAKFLEGYESKKKVLDDHIKDSNGETECIQNETKNKILGGTVSYAAPEQFGERFVTDKRTDIFQFGKTLQKIVNRDETDPFLYRELQEISAKCSSVKKQQRYTDIQKVRSNLMLCERNARRCKNMFKIKLAIAAALFVMSLILIIFSFLGFANPLFVAAAVVPGHFIWNDEGLSEDTAVVADFAKRKLIKILPFKRQIENSCNPADDGIFLDIVKTVDSLDFCPKTN